MKTLIAVLAFVGVLLFAAQPTVAQAPCQYMKPNAVLTAGQWNACFQAKLDVGTIPATSGTWIPTSPQTIGHVTNAVWQRVNGQICIQATFVMPTSGSTATAVVAGLPFPAVNVGQMGTASGGNYIAINGSQITFLHPIIGNPSYSTLRYTDLSNQTETIAACYS